MEGDVVYLLQASIEALAQRGRHPVRKGIAWLILSIIVVLTGLAIWALLK